jgi:hypothetical protein
MTFIMSNMKPIQSIVDLEQSSDGQKDNRYEFLQNALSIQNKPPKAKQEMKTNITKSER